MKFSYEDENVSRSRINDRVFCFTCHTPYLKLVFEYLNKKFSKSYNTRENQASFGINILPLEQVLKVLVKVFGREIFQIVLEYVQKIRIFDSKCKFVGLKNNVFVANAQ
jgi:hypothetical protein